MYPAFENHCPSYCTNHGGVYPCFCPVLYQLWPNQMGYVQIAYTIDEWNPKIVLETCDRCKRKEQKQLIVEGQVGHTLSAVPDQDLKVYPLRDLPELPSGRRTASQDHSNILGYHLSTQFCLQKVNAIRASNLLAIRAVHRADV